MEKPLAVVARQGVNLKSNCGYIDADLGDVALQGNAVATSSTARTGYSGVAQQTRAPMWSWSETGLQLRRS